MTTTRLFTLLFALISGVFVTSSNVQAELKLGDTITKGLPGTEKLCQDRYDGEPCLMSYSQAKAYCKKFAGGLPTIKELALAFNPKSVSEEDRDGFSEILNKDGEVDFYYQVDGRIDIGFGVLSHNYNLWSLSLDPSDVRYASTYYARTGGIRAFGRNYHPYQIAVRCLVSSD